MSLKAMAVTHGAGGGGGLTGGFQCSIIPQPPLLRPSGRVSAAFAFSVGVIEAVKGKTSAAKTKIRNAGLV